MSWLDTLEKIRSQDFAKAAPEEKDKACRDVINMCAYASAVVSVSPLPFSDALLMVPIQSGMVMTVAHVYGRRVESADARALLLEMSSVAGISFLARQGIKALLPVVGALLTVPAAFAANWAIGRVAMEYFKNPGLSKAAMQALYTQAMREGDSLFSRENFEGFRKKHQSSINAVARDTKRQQEPAPARPSPAPAHGPVAKKPLGKKSAPKGPATKPPVAKKPAATKKPLGKKAAPKEPQAPGPAPALVDLVEVELPRRIAQKEQVASRLNLVAHLDIKGEGGGQWTIDLSGSNRSVSRGLDGTPGLTITAGTSDFLAICAGKLDATGALMDGKLVFDPLDLEVAGRIGELFT